jgi:ribosomal protein L15
MSLLSESLTIGLLLTLVFGALFFYLYSRVTYAEKRLGLMENILIDIKMKEDHQQMHLPQIPSNISFHRVSNQQIHHNEDKELNVEELNVEELNVQELNVQESNAEELNVQELNVDELVNDDSNDVYAEVLEQKELTEQKELPEKTELNVNYEVMTKEELIEIAKKKGLNVGNRPGREKLLKLIRQSEDLMPENVTDN